MAVLENAKVVRELVPDMASIARMDRPGVIVTAPGDDRYDFVSRYFAPAKGIPEDPVTGAAHCMLAPYWAKRLGKTELRAFQASRRGGEVMCRLMGTVPNWKDLASSTWKAKSNMRTSDAYSISREKRSFDVRNGDCFANHLRKYCHRTWAGVTTTM